MVKPLFVGERVRLSPLTDSDLDVIAQWYAGWAMDTHVVRF